MILPALALGLSLFLGARHLYHYAQTRDTFRIQKIEVEGEAPLSKEEVVKTAGIDPDSNILRLDLEAARTRLVDHARIQSASVEKVLPSTVRIRVQPEVPVAIVNADGLRYVNHGGEFYDGVTVGGDLKLPLIQLEASTGGEKLHQRIRSAIDIIEWTKTSSAIKPENLGDIWVRAENYDGMAPLEITLELPFNAKQKHLPKRYVSVTLGENDLPKQLQRLEAVLKELGERGKVPAKIRMEFEKKVVVKIAQ